MMNKQELQEWDDMMAAEGWVLLSTNHPDYRIQQAFCEVVCRSKEQKPKKLFDLALADYVSNAGPDLRREHIFPPIRIRSAFRKWSFIQAANNKIVANDPWMKGLEAAEDLGPEARDQFMADNPRGAFQPLGKD